MARARERVRRPAATRGAGARQRLVGPHPADLGHHDRRVQTVLSIGHLGPGGNWRMVVDKLLAIDALIFLVSAAMSFMSMRSRRMGTRYESRAETIFIAGLGLLAMVAVVLAFVIT